MPEAGTAMENEEIIDPLEVKMQDLLNRYLRLRSTTGGFESQQSHLDEDSLTAFVEGNLSRREAGPMLSHLVACSFCRQVTAELIKLDVFFADEAPVPAPAEKPAKVSEVLGDILSRLFGTNDGAVFAHHEEKEEKEEKVEKEEKE